MGNRLGTRLLTAVAVGLLGAALVSTAPAAAATGQEAPAAADDSPFTLSATCVREGRKLKVDYTIRSWEPELTAPVVEVWYQIAGVTGRVPLPPGSFAPGQEEFGGSFLVDAPTEEGSTLVLIARAHWTDPAEKSITKQSAPLPLPVCPPEVAPATSTSLAPTTSVLAATSTSTAGQLPFTGTSSTPTLLAGLGLLAAGAVALWAGRTRGRHAR
jgi:hypothetical protein